MERGRYTRSQAAILALTELHRYGNLKAQDQDGVEPTHRSSVSSSKEEMNEFTRRETLIDILWLEPIVGPSICQGEIEGLGYLRTK